MRMITEQPSDDNRFILFQLVQPTLAPAPPQPFIAIFFTFNETPLLFRCNVPTKRKREVGFDNSDLNRKELT